ncbi:MAG: hypothetical protein ACE5DM_02220 [Candidatus Nanoarchaeia archaeon]
MAKEASTQGIVQYIGLTELERVEQEMVLKLVEEYSYKVRRALHNITNLCVHIKQHSKGGKRERLEIMLRAIAPTRIFEVKTEDWDLARAIHKAFKDLVGEIEHNFKSR